MPEASFNIRNNQVGRIRIEPTEIRSEGGPEYPRLVVPLRMDLSSEKNSNQFFVTLSVGCSMFLRETNLRIADSITSFEPFTVHSSEVSVPYLLEFPLDLYRIEKIEENRKGDLKTFLDLRLLIAMYATKVVQGSRSEDFLTDFVSQRVQLYLEIPKSHWVEKILPTLGYGKVRLLEVPQTTELITGELAKSFEEIRYAQDYFTKGDYDKSVEHCRDAIDPLKSILPKLKESVNSSSEYDWVKGILSATINWLDEIYKRTRELASKPHHLPSIGHFSRHDAETVMLITIALVGYVGRISE